MISFEVIWQAEGCNLYANVGVYRLYVRQAIANDWGVYAQLPEDSRVWIVETGESNSISEACELAERALHVELLRL